MAKELQRDSQKLLMALSEKESEGEKQTGWEREQDLDPKEGDVMQKIKNKTGVGGQERLNDADSTASLPVNLSPCGSHSSVHSSLKEIPLKTACA